jgi:hypothetical protein
LLVLAVFGLAGVVVLVLRADGVDGPASGVSAPVEPPQVIGRPRADRGSVPGPLVIPIVTAVVVPPQAAVEGGPASYARVMWEVGRCGASTIDRGTFHSLEAVRGDEGVVLTLRVQDVGTAYEKNPYDPNAGFLACDDGPPVTRIVPIDVPPDAGPLLDGWCSVPADCPIAEGDPVRAELERDTLLDTGIVDPSVGASRQ